MTEKRLQQRVAKLELVRGLSETRMVLRPNDIAPQGGGPFVMAPAPMATAAQWLATYAPMEVRHD